MKSWPTTRKRASVLITAEGGQVAGPWSRRKTTTTRENFARNNEALDLRGTLVNLVDFGISHQLLDWILCVETVASEHLHRIRDNLVGVVASKRFGHRGEHRAH